MDRDAVLAAQQHIDEFDAAPNYGKKQIVEDLIRSVLDQLDGERRDPDRWEAEHLAAAIGYLLADWYSAAIVSATKSLTPAIDRADPESWARTDDTVTTRALRDAIEHAAGKPARNW